MGQAARRLDAKGGHWEVSLESYRGSTSHPSVPVLRVVVSGSTTVQCRSILWARGSSGSAECVRGPARREADRDGREFVRGGSPTAGRKPALRDRQPRGRLVATDSRSTGRATGAGSTCTALSASARRDARGARLRLRRGRGRRRGHSPRLPVRAISCFGSAPWKTRRWSQERCCATAINCWPLRRYAGVGYVFMQKLQLLEQKVLLGHELLSARVNFRHGYHQ